MNAYINKTSLTFIGVFLLIIASSLAFLWLIPVDESQGGVRAETVQEGTVQEGEECALDSELC